MEDAFFRDKTQTAGSRDADCHPIQHTTYNVRVRRRVASSSLLARTQSPDGASGRLDSTGTWADFARARHVGRAARAVSFSSRLVTHHSSNICLTRSTPPALYTSEYPCCSRNAFALEARPPFCQKTTTGAFLSAGSFAGSTKPMLRVSQMAFTAPFGDGFSATSPGPSVPRTSSSVGFSKPRSVASSEKPETCVFNAKEDVHVDGWGGAGERWLSMLVSGVGRRCVEEHAPSPPTAKVRTPVRANARPGLDAIEVRRADVARRPRRSASAMTYRNTRGEWTKCDNPFFRESPTHGNSALGPTWPSREVFV